MTLKQTLKGTAPYIRLQIKLAFTPNKPLSIKAKIGRGIFYLLVMALFLLFSYALVSMLAKQNDLIRADYLCILWFTLAEIFVFVAGITMQMRRLKKPSDLSTILTLPVNSLQRYLGEIVSIFIKIEVFTFILFYPFILIYFLSTKVYLLPQYQTLATPAWIFTSMFAVLFMTTLPYCLSLVFVIPFITLSRVLDNKAIIKLILFIIVFAGIITAYCLLLSFMSDWYIHQKGNREVMQAIANVLINMDKWYNPAYYSSVMALNWKFGYAFMIQSAACIVFAAIGISCCYQLYKRFTSVDFNLESSGIMAKTKYDSYKPSKAIFINEFKNILRTPTYAYFFVGVALCMPILTYASIDIVAKLGQEKIGEHTFFGLALLVIMVIMSLIGSFSANTLSREQGQFYISKILPYNPKKQMFVKTLVNFIVAFIALVLCIVVLAATCHKTANTKVGLTTSEIFMIFAIATVFLIGLAFNGININLTSPRINVKGQASDANIVIQLLIGIIITTIMCSFIIVASAIWKDTTIYSSLIVLAIMLVYAITNAIVFVASANKKFYRIEVK